MRLKGFKLFFERQLNSLKKDKPEDHLDAMQRELGIDINSLDDRFLSGPIALEDEGLWFNQAEWEIVKPVEQNDPFIRLKFIKSHSPNINQTILVKSEDGSWANYPGDVTGRTFMVTRGKFAKMYGRPWLSALGGGPGGGLNI